MADTKLQLPVLSKDKSYERFKTELTLWKNVTTTPVAKMGTIIALSLPEDHPSKIKDKIFDQLSVADLSGNDGYDNLIAVMDKILLKDSLTDAFDKYLNFEKYNRKHESVSEFIEIFDMNYNKLDKLGIKLPSEILAFKLLIQCNLTKDEEMLVKSGIDYNNKANMYQDTKESLKKFKGDCTQSSMGCGPAISVKKENESVNLTQPRYNSKLKTRGGSSYHQGYFKRDTRSEFGQFQPKGVNFKSSSTQVTRGRGRVNNGGMMRPINPTGQGGQILRCAACDSVRHMLAECPHSYENMNAFEVEIEEDRPCLFTGRDVSELLVLSTEAQNCAVLDSACSSTVCGRDWLENYIQSLHPNTRERIDRKESNKNFRFGGGTVLPSEGSYLLPATLVGKNINIETDVVDSNIPLLLSKDAMKKASMKLDLETDTAEIYGKKVHLNCTSSGHYCVPIDPEHNEQDVLKVDLSNTDEKERKRVLLKLHSQFGHASSIKLIDLLKDAKVWNSDYKDLLETVTRNCEICKRHAKTPPRSVVSLPLAQKFNDILSLDLKNWESGYILHMIDVWSRYSMSVYIAKKQPQLVIDNLMKRWISVFGRMKSLISDNGGEFTAEEFKEVASILGVKLLTTAAEAPHQNGLNERVHSVIDNIVSKLKMQYPSVGIDILLGWANMAKNSLHMNHGYSSHQLVFGQNPNLPNILTDEAPALEGKTMSEIFAKHLNCLHSARQLFIQSESDERIRRALRHKIRACNEQYEKGVEVFYKKDSNPLWLGPAKVVAQDGKLVFVRHGNQLLRVAPNRLIRRYPDNSDTVQFEEENEKSFEESDEETIASKPAEEENESEMMEKEQTEENQVQQLPERRSLRQFNKNLEKGHEVYIVSIPKSEHKSNECRQAKEVELNKLKNFEVYKEVEDKGQPAISTRWILWRKKDEVRARLVARGFEEDIETTVDSPTISKCSMRLTIAIAVSYGWKIQSTDVKSAFLQSQPMVRDVYIKPPREACANPNTIWKLNRCLYGLGDAAKQFYDSVKHELLIQGCKISSLDPSMFIFQPKEHIEGILVSHIDDFLHCGNEHFQKSIIQPLCSRFETGSRQSENFKYVGFQITQSNSCITLDQHDYIDSIEIPKIHIARSMKKTEPLNSEESTVFRGLVGSLNWIVQNTRPDLSFELTDLSTKFQRAEVRDLQQVIKTLLKIKEEKSELLFPYLGDPVNWEIITFSDASFGNLCNGTQSCGGYVVFLAGNNLCSTLTWRSGKVKRVVKSTLAAEGLILSEALDEAIYIKKIICNTLNMEFCPDKLPIIGITDQEGLAKNLNSTKLVDDKRLRIDLASIKENLMKGLISEIRLTDSKGQLADVLTKKGACNKSLLAVLQGGKF